MTDGGASPPSCAKKHLPQHKVCAMVEQHGHFEDLIMGGPSSAEPLRLSEHILHAPCFPSELLTSEPESHPESDSSDESGDRKAGDDEDE
jgi:hypothetical protein